MPVPVLIGFGGVLVAAVATGMLAGLCVRKPRIDHILWTVATLGLTVALAAQGIGFAKGFGPVTFRAVQLSALLLVPLLLAWGLVELAGSEVARFSMRLASGALTVVAGVIVATDPLTARPFSKSWPLTGPHSQPVSGYALDAAEAVAVLAAVLTAGVAAWRAGRGPRRRAAAASAGPIALAVLMTAALRISFHASSVYPLLSALAAALVWFGVTRAQDPPAGTGGQGTDMEPDAGRAGEYPPGAPQGRPGGPPPRSAGRYPPAARPGPGGPGPGPGPGSGPGPGPAAARPYGRILIFTLLEDKVTDFDRLADQAAEEVRTGEPDTLVYVIHLVPDAPLQRIFYEIYRDRAAYESHESQPYMKRFEAERRSCVLATTVIELRLKYAKVAPLPTHQPAGPAVQAPPAGPGGPGFPPPAGRPRPPSAPLQPQPLQPLQPLPPQGPPRPPAPGRLPPGAPRPGPPDRRR